MKINWLLEYHFVRGNYAFCQKIMLENKFECELDQEYSTYIQVKSL